MALLPGHKQNFDTLRQAFLAGDVALMECQLVATGEPVAVICAANRQDDGAIDFAPLCGALHNGAYVAELVMWPRPLSARTTKSLAGSYAA